MGSQVDSEEVVSRAHGNHREPIAIVGMAALMPGSSSVGEFFRNVIDGVDLISEVPKTHWSTKDYYDPNPQTPDKTYANRGGFLSPVTFRPAQFGIPPKTIEQTDTTQLLGLVVADAVLRDALGPTYQKLDLSRVSCVLGVTSGQELMGSMVARLQRPVWERSLLSVGLDPESVKMACDRISSHYVEWGEDNFPGLLGNVVAGRIANRLNLGGTNAVTDAACASSLSAVSMAVAELRLGTCDLAIAGGCDTMNDIFMFTCFSKTPALSKSGDCRPFSDHADGTLLGEGLGMVALKRLSDAERDGDQIYALIREVGSSSDGKSGSVYAPSSAGQSKAIVRAYEFAQVSPADVDLVEAHGTGTKAGDAAELGGLEAVFGQGPSLGRAYGKCALGSVKSQLGHTKAAAGIAGLIKAALAVHGKIIPPSIKAGRRYTPGQMPVTVLPRPEILREQSPFFVPHESLPWISKPGRVRRAGVSAFGFGGSNFHVLLEEAAASQKSAKRFHTSAHELFLFAADLGGDLARLVDETIEKLRRLMSSPSGLSRAIRLLGAQSRASFVKDKKLRAYAIVEVPRDERFGEEVASALASDLSIAALGDLKRLASNSEIRLERNFGLTDRGLKRSEVAVLFPGQGSQRRGMGASLAIEYPVALDAWDELAGIEPGAASRTFPNPVYDEASAALQEDALRDTRYAQPAIGACSAAYFDVLRSTGFEFGHAGGHSFGELTAHYAAGRLTREQFLKLAVARGAAMADAAATAAHPGGMTAVSASRSDVEAILKTLNLKVMVANDNAPTQVVVAGAVSELKTLEAALSKSGKGFKRLSVSTAFHSPWVSDAAAALRQSVSSVLGRGQDTASADVKVYSNRTADIHEGALDAALAAQLPAPVEYRTMIQTMYARGARLFLEVGPGAVLSGLHRQILDETNHKDALILGVDSGRSDGGRHWGGALSDVLRTVGQLAVLGLIENPAALDRHLRQVTLESDVKGLEVKICGANFQPHPTLKQEDAIAQTSASRISGASVPNPSVPGASVPIGSHIPNRPEGLTAVNGRAVERVMTDTNKPYGGAAPLSNGNGLSNGSNVNQPAQPQNAPTLAAMLQSLADAHSAYQTSVSSAHRAYLEVAKAGFQSFSGVPVSAPQFAPNQLSATHVSPQLAQRNVSTQHSLPAQMSVPQMSAPIYENGFTNSNGQRPSTQLQPQMTAQSSTAVTATATSTVTAASKSTAASSSGPDLQSALLEIVADKTGYPLAMLTLEQELETELGIDSIKRVEIMSALKEKVPTIDNVSPDVLGKLSTLGEILKLLGAGGKASAIGDAVSDLSNSERSGLGRNELGRHELGLKDALLAVIAEKTGYPLSSLALEMELESDLGIDSIKRVEIMSSLKERVASLPDVSPDELGKLRTIQEIVDRLGATAARTSTESDSGKKKSLTLGLTQSDASEAARQYQKLYAFLRVLHRRELPKLASAGVPFSYVVLTPTSWSFADELTSRLVNEELVNEELATGGAQRAQLRVGAVSVDAAWLAELTGRIRFILVAPPSLKRAEATRWWFDTTKSLLTWTAANAVVNETHEIVMVAGAGGQLGTRLTSAEAGASGVSGFSRTVRLESTAARVRLVDVAELYLTEVGVELIAREVKEGALDSEVGIDREGNRWVPTIAPRPFADYLSGLGAVGSAALKPGVLLVTGGARGVTAHCLSRLLSEAPRPVVIVGRTTLAEPDWAKNALTNEQLFGAAGQAGIQSPKELRLAVERVNAQRELQKTLEGLRALSSLPVLYFAADVSDVDALRRVVEQAESELGPITSLVHAAGIIDDKKIIDKRYESFERVVATKVNGLEFLLDLLGRRATSPLEKVCVFSSVAAWSGNTGQSDYSFANQTMESMCAAWANEAPTKRRALAIGWGPWHGGMVSDALAREFARRQIPLIDLAAGSRVFAEAMTAMPNGFSALALCATDAAEGGHVDLRLSAESTVVGGAPERWVWTINGDARFMSDHTILGQRVVPMAAVLEVWKRAFAPFGGASFRNVEVVRGIKLNPGESGQVTLEKQSGAEQALSLKDSDGRLRYRAVLTFDSDAPSTDSFFTTAEKRDSAVTHTADVYGGALFHGPAYRGLSDPQNMGDVWTAFGLTAETLGWGAVKWALAFDLPLADQALQLPVLAQEHKRSVASLPMSVRRWTFAESPFCESGKAVITSRIAETNSSFAVFDVKVSDGARILMTLEGLKIFAAPSQPTRKHPNLSPDTNSAKRESSRINGAVTRNPE